MKDRNETESVSLKKLYQRRKQQTPAPESIQKRVLGELKPRTGKTPIWFKKHWLEISGALVVFAIVLPYGMDINRPINDIAMVEDTQVELSTAVPVEEKTMASRSQPLSTPKPAAISADSMRSSEVSDEPFLAEELVIEQEYATAADIVAVEELSIAQAKESAEPEVRYLLVFDGENGQFMDCQQQTVTLPVATDLNGWVRAELSDSGQWQLESAEKSEACSNQ